MQLPGTVKDAFQTSADRRDRADSPLLSCLVGRTGSTGCRNRSFTALTKARIPPSAFSAYVQEIGQDKPALSFNADTPRNPASTIKLVTTYLGLEALGPTYTWKTAALAAAPPHNGVLDGDLYLKGYGDPYLVLERFWLLVREIRQRGVREIRGDVVIDNTYFDVGPARPGDFDGRPYENYNVVPDALMINFQAVNFRFRPDPASGRVEIAADPMLANLQIRNQLQLVDGRCGEAEPDQPGGRRCQRARRGDLHRALQPPVRRVRGHPQRDECDRLRLWAVPRPVGGKRRHHPGQVPRRGGTARTQDSRDPRLGSAHRCDHLHQQAQQQRDGATLCC